MKQLKMIRTDVVVKIQRSINTPGRMLIYDKGKDYFGELPLSRDINDLLGHDMKGYFLSDIDDSGQIHVKQRIGTHDW